MIKECDDDNAGVGDEGCVVAVSAGCEYMGCTRGSGVVSISGNVLEISVVRWVRGAVECVHYVCVRLGTGWDVSPNYVGTGECGTCVCV